MRRNRGKFKPTSRRRRGSPSSSTAVRGHPGSTST